MPKGLIVKPGRTVKLASLDASSTAGLQDKIEAMRVLAIQRQRLGELQGRLYAENKRALLVVLQGMDTSGKDGTILHVFGSVSPMGCQVFAFGPPSEEERDHDFLWRIYMRLPRFGNIGVFNRSHYEDVLAARVRRLVPPAVWKQRYRQINEFEALVSDLGTRVLKIFLHIDRDEQRKRLEARLKDPAKNWKYQPGDLDDRRLWDDYQAAYEDALTKCSTAVAPWHIVPANRKWYRNAVVAQLVADTLEAMKPTIPKLDLDPSKIRIPR
jgi:PPK2 family polyphosphate:nucleotide phosphotransferase